MERKMAKGIYTDAPIIIHGPQGCGKTHNAAALMKHYNKSFAVDYDCHLRLDQYPADVIIFTNRPLPGAILFDEAMRAAGLDAERSGA
jgi:MoxR-like ATPase